MALRLSDPTPSTTAAPAQRAHDALGAGDTAGYLELFAAAGAIDDRHRRHDARKQLLQAGLTVPSTAPAPPRAPTGVRRPPFPFPPPAPAVIARALVAVAEAAITLLEAEPREPGFLNIAGVAFYELGALAPAERLLKAARSLDPQLPELARNLAQLERRKRAGTRTFPAVAGAVGPLSTRAKKVVQAARPATGMTLTLAMIVKDEEEHLGRCLEAAAPWVDQLVVVDTGSTDRTVEIAREHGAEVLHHAWTGDFAAARNVSFEAATGDWVMYLDADEVLYEGDVAALRALTGKVWREAMFLVETNHVGDLEDGTSVNNDALRIFRSRPQYRFEGRIHEQIAHRVPDIPERLERTNVRIEHFGYLGAVRDAKAKSRRNIELLERQAAEGHDSPFLHFNLGSEYGAASEPQRALEHFRTAWDQLETAPQRTRYGFSPSLCARLVKAQRCCDRHDEAIATGDRVLKLLPGFTDVVFEQGWAHRGKGDLAAALASFERCVEMGDAPSRYSAAV